MFSLWSSPLRLYQRVQYGNAQDLAFAIVHELVHYCVHCSPGAGVVHDLLLSISLHTVVHQLILSVYW